MQSNPSYQVISAAFGERVYYGWVVVFVCFWLALFAWGIGFYGHAIYLSQLRATRGWPTALLAVATTFYYLAGAVLVIFVGGWIDRFGPRRVVLVSILSLCLAVAVVARVGAPWQLFPVYLLMAVGWAGTSWTAIPTILARWFERRRGLAISIAFTGASAGGIVVSPMLIYLSGHYGFARATTVLAALALTILAPLTLLFLHRRPEGRVDDGVETEARCGQATESRDIRRACLKRVGFWSMAAAFALALTSQVGFLTHQVAALGPTLGGSGTALAIALTTAASIGGRIGLGFIVDRFEPRAVSAVAFAAQALALAVMERQSSPSILYLACVLYGVWIGNVITLPALIIQREFAVGSFGSVMGLATSISQFSFAFGPGLLGLVRDAAKGYGPALGVCVALDVLAALVVLARPRRANEP